MAESRGALLSLGVFLIILVVAILLFIVGLIDWTLILPVIMVLSGGYLLVIAATRGSKTDKYASSVFSSAGTGIVLIALGGAWYAFRFGILYSVVIILLVFGAIAIVAAVLTRK
jgi:hypothetical protein